MIALLKYKQSLSKQTSDYIITSLPILSNAIIDNTGNIYIGTTNSIQKSTDMGQTFETLKTFSASCTRIRGSFIDADGNIYFSPDSTSSDDAGLYRCADGANFVKVLTLPAGHMIWGIAQNASGDIFAGNYSLLAPDSDVLYKSTDNGLSFSAVYDFDIRHIHGLDVNGSNVYVVLGDTYPATQIYKSSDNGGTFSGVPLIMQMTDVLATPSFRLFGTDQQFYGRIYRTVDDVNFTIVLDTHYQNLFFFRQNPITGNIYAGFKLDPSATSGPDWPNTNYADIYKSVDDGITWELVERTTGLNAGDGYWFASNFYQNILIVGRTVANQWVQPLIIIDN